MYIEITEREFREEFIKALGKEPSADVVRFALAFNDMLNRREVNLYESDNSLSSQ